MTHRTVWTLAGLANCGDPDSAGSPGAVFLQHVRSCVGEITDLEDGVTEIADSCVPVYTHEKWQVFVDLCAYREDVSDYGLSSDMDQNASVALFMIAERLLYALVGEREGADEE
jgi:hypothetical protein